MDNVIKIPHDEYRHQAPDRHDGAGKSVSDGELDLVWAELKGLELV